MNRGISQDFKVRGGGLSAHVVVWKDDTVDIQLYRKPGRSARDAVVSFTIEPATALRAFLAQVEDEDWDWEAKQENR